MDEGDDSAGAGSGSQGAIRRGAIARWLPLLALPFAIALAWLLTDRADLAGVMHDDGVYRSMARSIEHGLGPVDDHLVPDARGARFPAFHPLLLALERSLVGAARDSTDGVRRLIAANALWLGVALALFLQLTARRGWPWWLALSGAALAFTSPLPIGLAQTLMSESLFTTLLLAALLALERFDERPSRGRSLAAGLLIGLLPAC